MSRPSRGASEDTASRAFEVLQWSGPVVAAVYVLLNTIVSKVRGVQQQIGGPPTLPRRASLWGISFLLATYVAVLIYVITNGMEGISAGTLAAASGSISFWSLLLALLLERGHLSNSVRRGCLIIYLLSNVSLLVCVSQLGARRRQVIPTIDVLRIARVVLLLCLLGSEVLALRISPTHRLFDEERTPLLWPGHARGLHSAAPGLSAREMLLKLERSFQPRSPEYPEGTTAADDVEETRGGSPATFRRPSLGGRFNDSTPSNNGGSTSHVSGRSSCYRRTCSWNLTSRLISAVQTPHEPKQQLSVEESHVPKGASTLTSRGIWKPDAPEFVPKSSRCQIAQSQAEVECRNFDNHTDPTVILRCTDQSDALAGNQSARADAHYAGRSCSQVCPTYAQKNARRATSS